MGTKRATTCPFFTGVPSPYSTGATRPADGVVIRYVSGSRVTPRSSTNCTIRSRFARTTSTRIPGQSQPESSQTISTATRTQTVTTRRVGFMAGISG